MAERKPLTRAAELDALDESEVIEGYFDGCAGELEPGDNRSLSYWHGWRNGAADKGHIPQDAAMGELVRDCIKISYFKHLFLREAA